MLFILPCYYFTILLYNNYFNEKYNINYHNLLNKEIIINNRYLKNYDCILVNYKYNIFFGFKYSIDVELKLKNNILIIENIDSIYSIKVKKKYYYQYIFYLLQKYSIFLKKRDFYIINYIKEFLY